MVGDRELATRYDYGAEAYDELYGQEQVEKYEVGLRLLPPRGRVIDVGCGTGLLLEYMASTGLLSDVEELVCVDISGSMLSLASRRISALCPGRCAAVIANAEALPFRDATFDVAYSFSVVNLLEYPAAAVAEIARVSRSSLVTLVPRVSDYRPSGWRHAGMAGKDEAYVRP